MMTKILFWENERRLKKLVEFRNLLKDYFDNSKLDWMTNKRSENDIAKNARSKINKMLQEIREIVLLSGNNPTCNWIPPTITGGYGKKIDIIRNIFNLDYFQISHEKLFDNVDYSIGIYVRNQRFSLIRTFNPFFYIGLLLDLIVKFPFSIIGRAGFDKQKIENSFLGRIFKIIIQITFFLAAFLEILQIIGCLEPFKNFVKNIFI